MPVYARWPGSRTPRQHSVMGQGVSKWSSCAGVDDQLNRARVHTVRQWIYYITQVSDKEYKWAVACQDSTAFSGPYVP